MSRPPTASARPGTSPGTRAQPVAGLVLGTALAVGAGTALAHHHPAPRALIVQPAGRIPASGLNRPPAFTDRPTASNRPSSSTLQGGSPTRLAIPAAALDATVVPVTVAAGALGVPDDVHTLGWWNGGPSPGAPHGTVVIDGHVDSARQGLGALAAASRLKLGEAIQVSTAHGLLTYQVQAIRTYRKDTLPAALFNPAGPPLLALITCGGPFDPATRHYRDNIVIYAARDQKPPLSERFTSG